MYQSIPEPDLLQDSNFMDFDEIKKSIDKDLAILEEAQMDFENDQKEAE